MDTLVLKYSVCPNDRVQLEPMVRKPGGREELLRIYTQVCSPAEATRRSGDILSYLLDAFRVMGRPLNPGHARGHVEKVRESGIELRELLLPGEIVAFLQNTPSIKHIVFRIDPLLNGIVFDAVYLWDDFLGFRYATGKQLLTEERRPPATPFQRDPSCYHGYRLVDPGGLLVKRGAADMPSEEQSFEDQWDRLRHRRDPSKRLADMIRLDDGVRLGTVSAAQLNQAFQHHDFIDLVCHHTYEEQDPEKSEFQIGPNESYSSRDLLSCLGRGTIPPLFFLSWACDSAATRGWEIEWPQTNRLYGMVDAAIRSGIRHYLSAVVEIPAERSPRFRLPLFREIACGETVGEAFRTARLALRDDQSDPLDGGTVFGLAFVMYGDPADAYFCAEGHRVDAEPIVACEAPCHGGAVCGKVVCRKEAGFGHARCNEHWHVEQVACSAGHPVQDAAQLSVCSKEGCRNTVCPTCPGTGQQLCWEHCCHEGHAIVSPAARKTCSDPHGCHSGEKRSVCPLDEGWGRREPLCGPCLRALPSVPGPPVCPHCGRFVNRNNPWAGVCEDPKCMLGIGMQQLCANCKPWYDQTTYCPKTTPVRSRQERDTGWIASLDRRGQEEQQLATQARLRSHLEIGRNFQHGLAANLAELRPLSLFPQLRLRVWDILLPHPRTFTVTESAIDLSAELARALQQRWRLPPDRDNPAQVWEPPDAWRVDFQQVNRLSVHVVKSLSGRRVLVAVATLTPVDFQLGRGPVLVPADADHLAKVETTLRDECQRKWPGSRQSVYFVVLSATGWALQGDHTDPPNALTIFGEPQSDQWKLTLPKVDSRPQYIQDFVRRLTPITLDERRDRIRRWIEKYLRIYDHVTVRRVQDALYEEAFLVLGEKEIQDTFGRLAATGRYVRYLLNDGQPALRPASRSEHAKHMLQRRWQDWAAWGASAGATILALGSIVFKNQSLAIGAIATAIAFQFLYQILKKLTQFLKQN